MVFTEIRKRKNKNYFYRVQTIRKGSTITKNRVYLGVNLLNEDLKLAEYRADKKLHLLNFLLSQEQRSTLLKIKDEYRKQPRITQNNRYEAFCSLFTHNSVAIEGSTFTLQETAQLLFDKQVPSSKSLREVNEVTNHKKAFDFILETKQDISKTLILQLHKLVTDNTLSDQIKSQIGKYREVQVYIKGVEWIPPKPQDVPKDMKVLLSWYTRNKKTLHPLILAAYFHCGFETIHPFIDGNGRVGRLLLSFILHKFGYPMINIPNKQKHEYYLALQAAQVDGDLQPFVDFLFELIEKEQIRF